jgi:hypothetical protein
MKGIDGLAGSPGRALARVEITENLFEYQLPAGSSGQVAVYAEHWHHFAIIRRILLRMKELDELCVQRGALR